MARLQTDPPSRPIEELLAEANAEVLANKAKEIATLQFCPPSLHSRMLQIDDLPEKELRKLIRSVSGAMLGIGLMSDEEIGEAMLLRLSIQALQTDDSKEALANIREWLDRKRGKPAQTITAPLLDMSNTTVINIINYGDINDKG